jgi:transcriptional regulator with XRE-family HTH domain
MNELDRTRAKILGLLVKDARRYAGRSVADCAGVLGLPAADFEAAETGERTLSLPELEALAMYLSVPLAHFWGAETLGEPHRVAYQDLLQLRRRVVGGLLKQARVDAGRTPEEVAAELKSDGETIRAYEAGEAQIPLLALERAGKYLGVPLDYFMDKGRGPLADHEAAMRKKRHFDEMPPEMQRFVTEPINRAYVETAMRLAAMDVNQLRRIAEGILDITL